MSPPQWSPLGMSGNTLYGLAVCRRLRVAAMEPARDEREYRRFPKLLTNKSLAAMEPARDEREYPQEAVA